MQRAIVVDLDGTLADCSHRINKAKDPTTGKIDWQIFYDRMEDDVLVGKVRDFVKPFRDTEHQIIIITGRPEEHRAETIKWLKAYEFGFDYLFMRPESDRRPAPIFKRSVYKRELEGEIIVILAIDDDPRVAEMFQRDLGIPCVVPGGLDHIQNSFNMLDRAAEVKIAEEVAGGAVAAAILNQDGLPDNTPVKWLRDYSFGLARKVATEMRR